MTDSNGTPLQTGDWVRNKKHPSSMYQVFIADGLLYLTGNSWRKGSTYNMTMRSRAPSVHGRDDLLNPLNAHSMRTSNWEKCPEPPVPGSKASDPHGLAQHVDQIVVRVIKGSFDFQYDRPKTDPPKYNRTGYAGPIDPTPKQ